MGRTKNKTAGLASIVLCALLLAGCAAMSTAHYTPVGQISAMRAPEDYKIGVGDELELKFFSTLELNDRQIVAPDGTISIMFAPHVQAAGLTTAQLMKKLQRKLESHVKQLNLLVVVRTFASQKAYAVGEVTRPGPVQLMGTETVMQVLGGAGWLLPTAGTDKVALMRRGKSGTPRIYLVNLAKIMDGSDLSQDIPVQGGDVILVPPSDAVVADRWIDQHIRQMLPLSTSSGITYNINPSVGN